MSTIPARRIRATHDCARRTDTGPSHPLNAPNTHRTASTFVTRTMPNNANICSSRPTVSQLLELAAALGISPLLLLAPLETPTAHLDLSGLSSKLSSMTSAQFDAWARGTDTVTAGRTEALLLRGTINQIRALHRELSNWRRAEQARRRSEEVDASTPQRAAYTDQHALTQQRRQARIDRLYNDLTDRVDLDWVHRPWRN